MCKAITQNKSYEQEIVDKTKAVERHAAFVKDQGSIDFQIRGEKIEIGVTELRQYILRQHQEVLEGLQHQGRAISNLLEAMQSMNTRCQTKQSPKPLQMIGKVVIPCSSCSDTHHIRLY